MANVVLVIDMVRGFLEPDYPLYCGGSARKIIPLVQRLLEEERANGSHIIFLCDHHAPDDLEFQMFPPHCVAGTVEAEIIPELVTYAEEVIPKTRYSAFYGTSLEERLRALKPDKIIVCGVCSDICVMHTVADARNRDYNVEVATDAVATFDEEAHRFALQHMEKILGARLMAPAEEQVSG
ncbi:MAG: cysteine hydrolase [Chloroflexi bacterium]|nr:cysteine hydrolase [Chloroflexota bacterium]